MSIIVGIDFSVLSTGMCIKNDLKNDYRFIWFPRIKSDKYPISKKRLKELPGEIEIVPYDIGDINDLDYQEKQILHLKSSNDLVEKIYLNLINLLVEHQEDIEVRLEGFSYGSSGQSMLDLVLYQGLLRHKIWKNPRFNLKFVTPSTLKKSFTGKGNAGKTLMVESFINKKIKNKTVFSLKNSLDIKQKNLKPYDDLIDAFALAEIELD